MKKFVVILLMVLFVSGGFCADELRGVWLRPPSDPAQIPVMLDEIADAGFNAVFVETFYHGFTISKNSPIPTRPEFEGKDILKKFIREGHKRGLEVHAWVEVFYWEVDTKKHPEFPKSPLLEEHPEWVSKLKNNDETWKSEDSHRFANPAHPEVRKLLVDYFKDLLERYNLDGLNLDYIRYCSGYTDAGYDEYTINLFKSEMKYNPTNMCKCKKAKWQEWIKWRENQVTGFLREVRDMQRETKPDILLSADIFSQYYKKGNPSQFIFQDWQTWSKDLLIDAVIPMAYGSSLDSVSQEIEAVNKRIQPSVKLMPGLAIGTNKKDKYSSADHPPIADQIDLVRNLSLPGHVTFCYKWIMDSDEGFKSYKDVY